MSLVSLFKGRRGASGFGHASTAEDVTSGIDLSGRTVVITGANSGLGQETARVLALRGAQVVCLARSLDKAEAAAESVGHGALSFACELSELSSVDACVGDLSARLESIDVLIANAGIMALPRLETKHGLELQFLTNHIGHFALVTGLLDQLSPTARVVMLSSYGHRIVPRGGIDFSNLDGEKGYSRWKFYGQSKLANLLFAKELARRFDTPERTANAVHPGVIRTNLGRHMGGVTDALYGATAPLFTKSVAQGAATTCYVAAHPDASRYSGLYFSDCNVKEPSAHANDAELAGALWSASCEIVEAIRAGKDVPHVGR